MRFDNPVGTPDERNGTAWPGTWVDATGFATLYRDSTNSSAYHTGADLNNNKPKYDSDRYAPVYASADGVVAFAGTKNVWGLIVTVKHVLPDGPIWTRYAHLETILVKAGQPVKRGDQVGTVGKPQPAGSPYHVQFDVARIDLGARPSDWPAMDKARLLRDYLDPKAWINSHREDDAGSSAGDSNQNNTNTGGTMAEMKWTPTDAAGTRVRFSPDTATTENVVGVIPYQAVVTGEKTADGKWLKVAIKPERMTVAGTALAPSALATFAGYVSAQFMKEATADTAPGPSPPSVPSDFKLGVSVLAVGHHLLQPAYDAGLRAFLIMEGLLTAVQFKQGHPGAVVMYRRFLPHGNGIPNPSLFSGESKMGNGVVFVTPLNECDNYCYGSPGEIEQRAKFDVALAQMCKQNGTIFAAGGFSMGTPDFTNPAICDAMRQFYAPAYNAGLLAMNMHLYSPNLPHINTPSNWQWYERRWEFLFTKCGFDPNPNLLGIYCDETGVDEGGIGGFPAHGVGATEIADWSRRFTALSRQPLVVDGKSYPSPMRGAAIFQAGENKQWAGYNVETNFGAIAQGWKAG